MIKTFIKMLPKTQIAFYSRRVLRDSVLCCGFPCNWVLLYNTILLLLLKRAIDTVFGSPADNTLGLSKCNSQRFRKEHNRGA